MAELCGVTGCLVAKFHRSIIAMIGQRNVGSPKWPITSHFPQIPGNAESDWVTILSRWDQFGKRRASPGKAMPFERNHKMSGTMPRRLIAAPGSGITENIVDKARKFGIRTERIGPNARVQAPRSKS